jgi:hypothetical protein
MRHGSIAAVCRALDMNRQQFNKYLAGSTLPAAATLEKISAFFRITPESLFQNPRGFRPAAQPNGASGAALLGALPPAAMAGAAAALDRMRQSTLRPGCYHFYYPWPRDPSKCVRAMLFVYRNGGVTQFTRFTKFRALSQRQRYYVSARHDGIVLESDRAKFLLATNRKGFGEISLVSFGVESAASPDLMSGLALVMGTSGSPVALRVTLEYRGASSLLRRTLADTCILPLSDPSIPDEVRQSVSLRPEAGIDYLVPFSLYDSLPQAFRLESAG